MKSCFWAALGFAACAPHAAGLPPGPPPEYERPALPPWDAGHARKAPEEPVKGSVDGGGARGGLPRP